MPSAKPRTLNAVLVWWQDTLSSDIGWVAHEHAAEWAEQPSGSWMFSAGVLVKQTKQYLLLTSISDQQTGRVGPMVRIPRGCISRIVIISATPKPKPKRPDKQKPA